MENESSAPMQIFSARSVRRPQGEESDSRKYSVDAHAGFESPEELDASGPGDPGGKVKHPRAAVSEIVASGESILRARDRSVSRGTLNALSFQDVAALKLAFSWCLPTPVQVLD